MTPLHLTKHHGLGNDFLVLLDPDFATTVTPELARALCDRREGIGADGLLHGRKAGDGADVDLTVWNADGSIAETSGNGLRCLAQAVVDSGMTGTEFLVRTGGQVRSVEVEPESAAGLRRISVSMGVPVVQLLGPGSLPDLAPLGVTRAARVDTGNPHLVIVVEDVARLDASEMERLSVGLLSEPVNLEAIRIEDDQIRMRVFERGVGETRACGSGAVAVAAAARAWDMAGTETTVAMPGGPVTVALAAGADAVLTGPAKFIGRIEVDPDRISP